MAAILTVSIRSRRRSGNAFSGTLFCPISIAVLTFHGLPVSRDVDGLALTSSMPPPTFMDVIRYAS